MNKINLKAPLTYTQVYDLNQRAKTEKIIIVFESTKGLKKETIAGLSDNITISITGGLTPKKTKFNNEHYQSRTYYTKQELLGIIQRFELIERKINPLWTDEEKMMFVYQKLCEHLNYQEDYFNGKDSCRNLLGMITGKSVCAGCAMIFKEAMDRLGIKCYYQNMQNHHGWNVVEINGKFYGIDLTWDVHAKQNNRCGFLYFCREDKRKFYSNEHHDLSREEEESECNLESIPFEKLQKMYNKINEERITYKKTEYSAGQEVCQVMGKTIVIKNNQPYCLENSLMTFKRNDNTSFMVIPTGKYDKGLYEYIYLEYDYKTKEIRHTNIYSESRFITFDKNMRANIANNLLSRERVRNKINNYNGYVGYVIVDSTSRYYNPNVEENILNIYR